MDRAERGRRQAIRRLRLFRALAVRHELGLGLRAQYDTQRGVLTRVS
jgi:hypothetical protein